MDRRRAAGALLALAACIACSTAAPTASNQTALELFEGPSEGCYYNFQHYGEGDRIMTNEPCLNCTCHNRMLMCYLKVCPFTKPIGQDCTIEKRADQCCPIVTCPDVPVDLLTSTSTSSPAEYGATGLGKVDKYGCSIHGKYFPEGSKVPPTPNKPCEHCYCIRNMTTCVMQECTLHVDGCTPIYNKDVCCPVRYSCDHLDDEMLLLDDMTTTVRPTPGFLLTTTTMPSVTQITQNCVHDDQIFADGALIKTEVACEHCYCMKGDIVCVVQECGTPMENEGKNCTSLPPRQGQCCPDTYICEGDEILTEPTTSVTYEELTTVSPPRRVEGSGYRNEPDEPYTEIPAFEGSGEEHSTTLDSSDNFISQKQTPQIIDETFAPTEESLKPILTTSEPDKEQNTVPDDSNKTPSDSQLSSTTTVPKEPSTTAQPSIADSMKETDITESKTTSTDYLPSEADSTVVSKDDELIITTESVSHYTKDESSTITENHPEVETTKSLTDLEEVTTQQSHQVPSSSEASNVYKEDDKLTTSEVTQIDEVSEPQETTSKAPKDDSEDDLDKQDVSVSHDKEEEISQTTTESRIEQSETTSVNPVENEINEDILPPGRIPGEGDCLLNGITYKNSSNVPNINNCHSSCKCVSSIVKCDPIICSPPLEYMDNMNDCQPIYDTPDACCPTYICNSRETIPPESHSQMSGTESPKPSVVSECYGDQCEPDKTKPISHELCNSDGCKLITDDQDKECLNGVCGTTDIGTPPLKHPEACNGENCMPSDEICTDGKCQTSSTSQTACDSENGCQPSEACVGNNCAVQSEGTIVQDKLPICNDSEECKITDASKCDGPNCDISGVQVPDKNVVQSECKEEDCERKDYADEHKSPSECSDSSCIAQGIEGEPGDMTTETALKDKSHEESTTEKITDAYTKLPESQETPSDETLKVTHFEPVTENQDVGQEHSTPGKSPVEDISPMVTEKEPSYTDDFDSNITKMETITETYNTPETEDHQTVIPDTHTTKSKEHVTEPIDDIMKEIFTHSPFATGDDKYPSDLPKEDTSDIPTEPFEGSTDTLAIEPHDQKDTDHVTETKIVKDDTDVHEITTEPADILETTPEHLEKDVYEQEITNKQEVFTESPKEKETPIETQDNVYTESQQSVSVTESSATLLTEMTSEDHIGVQVKDDEETTTGEYDTVTNIPDQTSSVFDMKEPSETHDSKLEETTTKTILDEIEKGLISTESPNVFTEVISMGTTIHELHKIDEDTESPQTTEIKTSPATIDLSRETTESSVEPQEDLSVPTDMYATVTDKQDAYTSEIQEHVTPDSSIVHATQPSTTEKIVVTQAHDIPSTQEDETNLADDSPTPTTLQGISMEEISTQQPGVPTTNIQEISSETSGIHDIPSQTVSDKLEDQTDIPKIDANEVSTIKPDETFLDDTSPKEPVVIEPHETSTSTDAIPVDEVGVGTTIPSELSDKDREITTKYTDTETGLKEESTAMPEMDSTRLSEPTTLHAETDKQILETSTIAQEEKEAVTTEYLQQPYEDKNELPDFTQTRDRTQEPSIGENTLAPTVSYTEGYSDDQTVPVSIDESKKEKPQYTTPDTVSQFTERQEAMVTHDYVTKGFEEEIKAVDASEEPHELTEYTASNEMDVQNVVTLATEIATQSQDTETKLAPEFTGEEIASTPTHVLKEEKEQTESPMSLVTEPSELEHSEDADHSIIDKTTEVPSEKVPGEEKIEKPDYDTMPQTTNTESPQLQETDSKTPSHIYPETESPPESSFTTPLQESTTIKALDIHENEKTPSITSTDDEKLATATENLDIMQTQNPVKTESELYPTDISYESTPGTPVMISSEESRATEKEEIATEYTGISDSVTTVSYERESHTKPENIPIKDQTVDTTEQPQNKLDATTVESITSEILKEENEDTQQTDKTDDIKDSEHISPSEYTTKYPGSEDKPEYTQTGEPEPSKQEEYTEEPEQPITSEAETYPQRPISPDSEIQSSEDIDHEKTTEAVLISDENGVTTPKEESMAGITDLHLITSDIPTTESSEMLPIEESNRRTLSPSLGTIQTEQYTTEKQKVTELPEVTTPLEMEQIDISQETPLNEPEKESTVTVSITDEFDHATSLPTVTEDNLHMVSETVPSYKDENLPPVTEGIEEQTMAAHDITLKPETEYDVIKDITTEQPLIMETGKDVISDKTTVHEDLIDVPLDTQSTKIPSEDTLVQESPTESSVPKETKISESTTTEISVPLVTEEDLSVPTETDVSVSKATESSTIKETMEQEFVVPELTESSVPKETELAVSEVTDGFVSKETGADVSEVTEASISEITEISETESSKVKIPEVTPASETETTEGSMHEITDVSATEPSKSKTSELSEASKAEVTESSVSDITEASIPEITKAVSETTEQTEVSAIKVTEVSVAETTDSSVSDMPETTSPKENENEIKDGEPEAITYKPKDEESKIPVKDLVTSEPQHSSSETTPYLVELQEHTTKVDEEVSSVPLTEEDRTKAPEIYQTERGDQPLDNIPDKFTPEDSHEEYTTKEVFTNKDEQLTTLPPKQAIDYTEKLPDKTDTVTEEVLISTESSISTLSNAIITTQKASSEDSSTVIVPLDDHDKYTTAGLVIETTTDKKDITLGTEKTPEHEVMHEPTSLDDLLVPVITKATTIQTPEELTTNLPVVDKFTKPEPKPSESYSPTTASDLSKPGLSEILPSEELPSPDFPPSGSTGYGQEPDYVEEDQPFGPGTCRYGGKVYVSAQQIPRDDPCDFCFCFRSDIICLQQSCPPPIHGCHEEPIQGFCCPRYECPVSMATTLNVTTTTTTTTTTLPPHFLPHAYKGAAQRRGCQIKGHSYKVGEVVRASSGPCLHCTCGGDGQMKCDPKACTPEPMLRQMIAAAVSAKRRR